jgi:hypothetical protein
MFLVEKIITELKVRPVTESEYILLVLFEIKLKNIKTSFASKNYRIFLFVTEKIPLNIVSKIFYYCNKNKIGTEQI